MYGGLSFKWTQRVSKSKKTIILGIVKQQLPFSCCEKSLRKIKEVIIQSAILRYNNHVRHCMMIIDCTGGWMSNQTTDILLKTYFLNYLTTEGGITKSNIKSFYHLPSCHPTISNNNILQNIEVLFVVVVGIDRIQLSG